MFSEGSSVKQVKCQVTAWTNKSKMCHLTPTRCHDDTQEEHNFGKILNNKLTDPTWLSEAQTVKVAYFTSPRIIFFV